MLEIFHEHDKILSDVLEDLREVKKENVLLKQKIQLLESKIDDIEIKEKANNIIIVGVPSQRNTDTKDIVQRTLRQ